MYGKIFASTFTGSMFGAGADVFAVWGYVLANTVNSTVELNPVMLAAVLGMDRERVEQAIEKLSAPDPRSRNPQQDGRRIVHQGGFQYHVTSHEIYRNIRNDDERRTYNREAQRRSRANRGVVNSVIDGQSQSSLSAHTEAESEAETETETESRGRGPAHPSSLWSPGEWRRRYGIAWCDKYQQIAYGMAGDSKACANLSDVFERLTDAERLEAQADAPRMFAEFFGRNGKTKAARHPFAFFVTEWGGLRVPEQQEKAPPFKPRLFGSGAGGT